MKKQTEILIHIGLWISVTMLSFIHVIDERPDELLRYSLLQILGWVYSIPIFYFAYSVLIPNILAKKRIWFFVLLCTASIFLSALLIAAIDNPLRRVIGVPVMEFTFYKFLLNGLISSSLVVLFASVFRFTIDWFKNQKVQLELINKNQASELALMKSQINPHFLFNTLNNIYSLVNKHDDKALDAMGKLSDIMRYLIYDAQSDKVTVNKEIEYLESYIELQRLRHRDPGLVEYKLTGNADGLMIAPMLLIPFVENAFKHGDRKATRPNIIISLKITSKVLYFKVTNFIPRQSIEKDQSGGIGLSNIMKRLEILYKGKHKLEINSNNNIYESILEIDLEK